MMIRAVSIGVLLLIFSGEGGIRTHGGPEDHNGFRDRPIQPLWHLSIVMQALHARRRVSGAKL
jgi:hypothetical protein